MASRSKALKEPILEDDKSDENDFEDNDDQPVINSKEKNDLKVKQISQDERLKPSRAEVEATLVSNSIQAAGNIESKMSHVDNDAGASSGSFKRLNSNLEGSGNAERPVSSSKHSSSWISFEDDLVEKTSKSMATKQNIVGTPLAPVVNGDLNHRIDQTTTIAHNNFDGIAKKPQEKLSEYPKTKNPLPQDASNTSIDSNIQQINGHISQNVDELSSPYWVTFDEDSKGAMSTGRSATVSSSGSAHPLSPTQPDWVTFDELSKQMKGDLSVNVSIPDQTFAEPSTPSPNPFLNAPMSISMTKNQSGLQGPSPLSVVTNTNPFLTDESVLGLPATSIAPYPLVLDQQGVDLSQWHDVSVLERGFKPDGTPNDEVPPPLPQTEEAIAVTPTVVDHIEEGITKVAEVTAEEKPSVIEESDSESLGEDFSLATTNTSWNMFLRFPDKKRKITPREWKSVVIKLDGNTLQIYEEYELSAPFREIPLQASFSFDPLRLQPSGRHGKVHTTKLVYLNYKETRSVRQKGTYEHIAEGMPIIKVGSQSHIVMREFMEAIGNSIRTLPAYRDRGITYRKDEVFVDIDDTCYALVGGDGTVKKQGGNVMVKIRAFLTGDPECQLVLNDVTVKEREEARLRGELKPQRVHHWIKIRECNFHKCVDETSFSDSHAIIFHPLDACTFELMRFRVKQHKPLPLCVKAALTIHSEQRIELSAEIKLCQDTKMSKYARNNVTFRLPIPETWVPLFRTGGFLGREKSIKSSKGKRAAGIKSRLKHSKCSIAASLGTAKYEAEYSAVVWRIDKLPLIQSNVPVDAPQTLNCVLELPRGMECPETYRPYAELEYDVSHDILSDTTVIAVKVSNKSIPEKWVCYRAFYQYHIDMDVHRPSTGPVKDVGCAQQ
ncbi:stonin-2 [Exaiptasia diaphana]|uniref:Uncharacterized protein n=1 Tax=Exaiptasia diaphana TaxID=2652724 RepID=A0A913XDS2_EXADI|nr:stonin-2 [Exaiptasia diaphana]KXJ29801.1 Stonin-2 [Exaiptasia diaphana]